MQQPWTINHREGTAVGPVIYVEAGNTAVEVRALWSDDEGVGVDVQGPNTELLITAETYPAFLDLQDRLREAVDQLLALAPPNLSRA